MRDEKLKGFFGLKILPQNLGTVLLEIKSHNGNMFLS